LLASSDNRSKLRGEKYTRLAEVQVSVGIVKKPETSDQLRIVSPAG